MGRAGADGGECYRHVFLFSQRNKDHALSVGTIRTKKRKEKIKMTEKKKEHFYKQKGFWAAVASAVAGLLAGNMGAVEAIGNVINYIVGG